MDIFKDALHRSMNNSDEYSLYDIQEIVKQMIVPGYLETQNEKLIKPYFKLVRAFILSDMNNIAKRLEVFLKVLYEFHEASDEEIDNEEESTDREYDEEDDNNDTLPITYYVYRKIAIELICDEDIVDQPAIVSACMYYVTVMRELYGIEEKKYMNQFKKYCENPDNRVVKECSTLSMAMLSLMFILYTDSEEQGNKDIETLEYIKIAFCMPDEKFDSLLDNVLDNTSDVNETDEEMN